MKQANQSAEGDFVHDEGDAVKGFVNVRNVVEHEQQTGDDLDGKNYQQNAAERVPGVDVGRQEVARAFFVDYLVYAEADVKPVIYEFAQGYQSRTFMVCHVRSVSKADISN